MAAPLFIFAATICRFVGDYRWDPQAQLELVLEYKTAGQENQLERTYRPILDHLLVGLSASQKQVFVKQFQLIIGSIVTLESPLSSKALANLLCISRKEVNRKLDQMHSVLDVPPDPDLPIRLLHLLFRDFLVGSPCEGTSDLFIDGKQAHKTLSSACLRLLLQTDCLKTGHLWSQAPRHASTRH